MRYKAHGFLLTILIGTLSQCVHAGEHRGAQEQRSSDPTEFRHLRYQGWAFQDSAPIASLMHNVVAPVSLITSSAISAYATAIRNGTGLTVLQMLTYTVASDINQRIADRFQYVERAQE